MSEDLKWLIGISVSMVISFIIALIGSFRSLSASLKEGDDKLHDRINRVREDYVRRDDLDAHIDRLSDGMKEVKDESRETNKRLDQLLAAMAQDKR